mmetsp:Transcript_32253/g.62027  ORF Transcript_32253/g.62027 Transcript_32253/m.62027 type:complete len:191 (+) Transcript_32253:407-979(+)
MVTSPVVKVESLWGMSRVDSSSVASTLDEIGSILGCYASTTISIFRHYAARTNSAVISMPEFLALVTDCKLTDEKLTSNVINTVFREVGSHSKNASIHIQAAVDHPQKPVEADADHRCGPEEFLEVLLWLATIKYNHSSFKLPFRLCKLMEEHLKPDLASWKGRNTGGKGRLAAGSVASPKGSKGGSKQR